MTYANASPDPIPSDRKILGLRVVTATPRDDVCETRRVLAPDGSILICRRRKRPDGEQYWTAEIPLEIAKDIYDE